MTSATQATGHDLEVVDLSRLTGGGVQARLRCPACLVTAEINVWPGTSDRVERVVTAARRQHAEDTTGVGLARGAVTG